MRKRCYTDPSLACLLGLVFMLLSSFTPKEADTSYPVKIPVPDSVYTEPVALDTLLSSLTVPVIDSLCIVADEANSLQYFFEELSKLRSRKDTVINIVHLGDSHIQAGYYSGRMMRLIHQAFGNAGRGWIAPFKLAKLNEPDDYFISSVVKEWVPDRITRRVWKSPAGLGGISIQSISPSINLDVIIAPKNGAGYGFNKAVLFRGEKSMPMLPAGSLKDSVHSVLASQSVVPFVKTDTFYISCLTDTLLLHSTRRIQGTDSLAPASSFESIYYGLTLSNGGSGILYHSIGVNGAKYVDFTDEGYVSRLAMLKPSLLIISLGTNETFGARFRSAEFSGQVKGFLALARRYFPEAAILLTTPPECYRRARVDGKRIYVRNANTEYAARAIKEVAEQSGIACWDLFAATGGKNSNVKWYNKKLMGRDRIHYTKEGYKDQGTLLFYSLMQLYNNRLSFAEAEVHTGTVNSNADDGFQPDI